MARKPAQKGVTVTFTEAVEVLDHNGDIEQAYAVDQVVDLHPASAQRWISRGMAVAGKTTVAEVVEAAADESAADESAADESAPADDKAE